MDTPSRFPGSGFHLLSWIQGWNIIPCLPEVIVSFHQYGLGILKEFTPGRPLGIEVIPELANSSKSSDVINIVYIPELMNILDRLFKVLDNKD